MGMSCGDNGSGDDGDDETGVDEDATETIVETVETLAGDAGREVESLR
jgi:hypothetical protein